MIEKHEIAAMMKSVAGVVKAHVAGAVGALTKRMDELAASVKAITASPPDIEKIIKDAVNSAVSALPAPVSGKDADPLAVMALVDQRVALAVAAIPAAQPGLKGDKGDKGESIKGDPGKDADPALIVAEVERAVSALPKPKDGTNADPVEIFNQLRVELAAEVAALPKPLDGQAPTPAEIKALVVPEVERAVAALKPPKDGLDADPLLMRAMVTEAVAALPRPKDGASIHPDTVALMVRDAVDKAVAAIPPAPVVEAKDGRDAAQIDPLPSIDETRSYARGTWASHAGGLIRAARATDPVTDGLIKAGWVVMVEGISAVVVTQGEDPRELSVAAMLTSGTKAVTSFAVPMMIYREVWRDGEYAPGDVVTWGGSAWHCQEKTTDKPGNSPAWKMMVKEGRPGKDGKSFDAVPAAREPVRLS